MNELGWNDLLLQSLLQILLKQIEQKLECIKGNYSQPILKKLKTYLHKIIMMWINEILDIQCSEQSKENLVQIKKQIESSLEQKLLSSFASMRTGEMFEIFNEFPDSSPCLNDLKYALD